MKIIFLGAPGSGKGSLCKVLKQEYGFSHLSTGDIFRQTIAQDSPLGAQLKSIIVQGQLVDDKLTNEVLENAFVNLSSDQKKDVVFDGYPRNINQAIFLDKLVHVDAVINVCVPDEVIVQRVCGRRTCPKCGEIYNIYFKKPKHEGICDHDGQLLVQRVDDCEETIKIRLATFKNANQPLVDFYRSKGFYHEISNLDFDQAQQQLCQVCQLKK